MCRHLAHLGPPTTLAALLLDPPHGLLHQSYAPADMRGGGTVNADGFGAGWYPSGAGEPPVRYRSDRPMWADPGFTGPATATTAGAVLAAVRSATVGMHVTTTAVAPFAEGRWLFSHNGVVRGWPGTVAALAAALPVTDLLTLDAPTDSALLWALVRHRLRTGADPAAVLVDVVHAVDAAAPGSRLNLLLTDGATIWATTWTHALAVRVRPGAVTVASEPTDPGDGWTRSRTGTWSSPPRRPASSARCRRPPPHPPRPPDRLPRSTTTRTADRRLLAFLGGTIGNLEPAQQAVFLTRVRAALRPASTCCSARGWSPTPAGSPPSCPRPVCGRSTPRSTRRSASRWSWPWRPGSSPRARHHGRLVRTVVALGVITAPVVARA